MSNTPEYLARMIAARKAKIASVLKTAAPGDDANGGTAPTVTGKRLDQNAVDAATPSDAMVEATAKDNPVGASMDHPLWNQVPIGASETDGSHGSKGAVVGEAGKLAPGSTGKIASELRAMAKAIETDREAKIASMGALGKFFLQVVKSDEGLKVAAEGMEDSDAAGQAIEQLMQQLQSGQITDEDAQKILQEMVQAGAITPEEVAAIEQELAAQGAGAGAPPADAGAAPMDPAAAAPMDPAMGADPAMAMEAPVQDPALEAKLAAVDIGPDHAQYAEKLEALYGAEVAQGEHFCLKVAQHLGFLSTPKVAEVAPMIQHTDADVQAAAKSLGVSPEEAKELMATDAPKIASAADAAKVALLTRLALRA